MFMQNQQNDGSRLLHVVFVAMHGLTIKGNRKSFSSLLALWGKLLVKNLDLIIHSK